MKPIHRLNFHMENVRHFNVKSHVDFHDAI